MVKKFSGELRKHIKAPEPIGIINAEMPSGVVKHFLKEFSRIENERNAKLRLLAQHYGIPPTGNYYRELALAIAMEFVPGFSVEKRKGAPKKWPDILRAALVVEMREHIKPGTEKGPTHAAKIISKRNPWKFMVEGLDQPAEALLNVYKKAVKNNRELVLAVETFKAKGKLAQDGRPQFDVMIEQYISELTGRQKKLG